MNNAKFDVTAIGNAIVDVIAQADDALLVSHNLPKGAMNFAVDDHGPTRACDSARTRAPCC